LLAATIALAGETKEVKEQWTGSIPVSGQHSKAELTKMAKVSMADAEKTALAAVEAKDADKRVKERELEVERGYLIYSFNVAVTGRKGIEEIIVDAGTGKVLAHERE
jgi:uncharacterized membrane protein YkoI